MQIPENKNKNETRLTTGHVNRWIAGKTRGQLRGMLMLLIEIGRVDRVAELWKMQRCKTGNLSECLVKTFEGVMLCNAMRKACACNADGLRIWAQTGVEFRKHLDG